MNDNLLAKRRIFITNDRTVCRVVVTVYPRIIYPDVIEIGAKVNVALEIVHDMIVDCRKAPDIPFPRTIRLGIINFIDPPIIGLTEFEKAGRCISELLLVLGD
ncbi:hypothetical protein ES703_64628 [subsurface metagenome]